MRRPSERSVAGTVILYTLMSGLSGLGCSPRDDPADRIRLSARVQSGHSATPSHDASVHGLLLSADGLVASTDEERLSAAGCRLERPPGDCDRCPDHSCRQVLVRHDGTAEWISFCDAGNLREEAWIACRCAGGNDRACRSSAMDTARALLVVTNVFGGDVPRVGRRYRDANGSKRVIGTEEHDWLALRVAAPMTLRCDPPDPEAADARYAECERWARAGY